MTNRRLLLVRVDGRQRFLAVRLLGRLGYRLQVRFLTNGAEPRARIGRTALVPAWALYEPGSRACPVNPGEIS
jgi:hypothetical protein